MIVFSVRSNVLLCVGILCFWRKHWSRGNERSIAFGVSSCCLFTLEYPCWNGKMALNRKWFLGRLSCFVSFFCSNCIVRRSTCLVKETKFVVLHQCVQAHEAESMVKPHFTVNMDQAYLVLFPWERECLFGRSEVGIGAVLRCLGPFDAVWGGLGFSWRCREF